MKEDRRKGIFYIVGVGPGDPELMTLKACRVLERCPVLAVPRTASGNRMACDIACQAVDLSHKEVLEMEFPMSRDIQERQQNIVCQAHKAEEYLLKGQDLAMLNIGDVSVYSTAAYVRDAVRADGFETVVIPGVPSFSAAAAVLNTSLVEGSEQLHIIPAGEEGLEEALTLKGTKILMKSGKRILSAVQTIEEQGLLENASAAVDCGLETQQVFHDIREIPEDNSYFAIICVKDRRNI